MATLQGAGMASVVVGVVFGLYGRRRTDFMDD